MLRSSVFNQKPLSATPETGNAIYLVLMGTAFLHLMTPTREYLVPYAPYIMFALQVVLPFVIMPNLRWRLSNAYNDMIFVLMLLFVLFVFSLASGIWSAFPELVLQRSLLVFLPILLIGLLVWSDYQPVLTFLKVVRGLVFFVSVLATIGILLFFFGSEDWLGERRVQTLSLGPITLSQGVYGIPPLLRISSVTGNPNTLAAWLVLSLPLTLYLIHTRKVGRVVGKIAFALQLFALILTYSRAGIGATLVALATYYLWSAPRLTAKLKRSLLTLTIGMMFTGSLLMMRLEQFGAERLTLDLWWRDVAWRLLTNAFVERPCFGIGFGVSYEAVLEPNGLEITSHNAHLQTLVEIGVFGYLLVLILWLFPLQKILHALRQVSVKEQRLSLVVIASVLVSLFAHQFFEGSLLRYAFYNLFWGYVLFVGVHPGMRGE